MQMIKAISITNGIPTISLSLIFIILVSMSKDLVEEYKRWESDRRENENKTQIMKINNFQVTQWKNLQAGHIIKIQENEQIPADVILLHIPGKDKNCYV